jgi:hypothetical protein
MTRYGPLVPVNAAVIYEALPDLDEHCAPIAPYRWDELAPRGARPRSSEGGVMRAANERLLKFRPPGGPI